MKRLIWLAAVLCAASPGLSQVPGLPAGEGLDLDAPLTEPRYLQAEAVASHKTVQPGMTFHVALELTIQEGWAYYSPAPGVNYLPDGTEIRVQPAEVTVDAGTWQVGPIRWPMDKPYRDPSDPSLVNHVYKNRAVVVVPVTVPPDATAGSKTLTFTLTGQVCSPTSCIETESQTEATVRVGSEPQAGASWDQQHHQALQAGLTAEQLRQAHGGPKAEADKIVSGAAAAELTIWAGLGLALLAGLALNIMPCVLPVIPLRILSLVDMARESRRRIVLLGLTFAGGMVLFFIGVAAVSAAVRAATGQAVNLSDHFQLEWVRLLLALVVVALAANLFGVFNVVVPSRLAGVGQAGPQAGGGYARSAGMGLMMAVLATPCSFAILVGAMAWAQVQPLWLGSLAIVLIGVGMAAPHALLTSFPSLLAKLPRPGAWMEYFKQSMGFLMLLVAVWLFSTFSDDAYPFWLIAFAVVLAMGLWIWANWVRYDAPLARKLVVRGIAVAIVVAAGLWMIPRPTPLAVEFEPFSRARINEARAEGSPVLVKFTASWCTKCQVLDYTVFDSPEVARALQEAGVVAVRADVTAKGTPASEYLRQVGGAPPLTRIFPPGGGPAIRLEGSYSKEKLLEVLGEFDETPGKTASR